MPNEGYAWWIERIRRTFELVDIVRIDHFRGFAALLGDPGQRTDGDPAAAGCTGPGKALFKAISKALGPLPIIAEDLGVITPDVVRTAQALRACPACACCSSPSASDGASDRLPAAPYEPDTVVYTGTHDNDTTLGWWRTAPASTSATTCASYLACDGLDVGWDLIRAACASVADTAIYALQDVLGLDGANRMNFPGKAEGNWRWRFTWQQVHPHHASRLRRLCELYERPPRANESGAAVKLP